MQRNEWPLAFLQVLRTGLCAFLNDTWWKLSKIILKCAEEVELSEKQGEVG